MLEIYAFPTPNSLKVPIALEEMGLEYRLIAVDLRKGEQKAPAFIGLNPVGKVPVLVDRSASGEAKIVISESAAILVYLAEKTDALLPRDGPARSKVFEQLFFHASSLSPAYLQAFYLSLQPAPDHDARARALREVDRVLGLLAGRLAHARFAAGDVFSIADIAHFGWLWRTEAIGASLDDFPAVSFWYEEISERPAVQTAIAKTLALAS